MPVGPKPIAPHHSSHSANLKLIRGETEFGVNFVMRDALTVVLNEPSLGFSHTSAFIPSFVLVVNGRAGRSPRDWVKKHELKEAD